MAKERRRFDYPRRTEEQVRQRAEQRGGMFDSIFKDGVHVFTPKKADEYRLRIIQPTWPNPVHYGWDIHVHYGIGPDDSSYLCPKSNLSKPCPICEDASRAKQAGKVELAKELLPTKRVLVWVIDRANEKEGPMVWSMPWTFDRDLITMSRDSYTGGCLEIDHPDEGYDINFSREGKGLQTKYVGLNISRRSSPLHDQLEQQEDWLEYVSDHPLPGVLYIRDYEYIRSVYFGESEIRDQSSQQQPAEGESNPPLVRGRDRGSRQTHETEQQEPSSEEPRFREPERSPEQEPERGRSGSRQSSRRDEGSAEPPSQRAQLRDHEGSSSRSARTGDSRGQGREALRENLSRVRERESSRG